MTARFVAFEGGEGTGKSTQAVRLAERMGALLTREPGGTDIGRRLRKLLLDPDTENLDRRAEALLMAADRAQHVAEVVRPALAAGRSVVTDRFTASSLAYQGYGRGLDVAEVRRLSEWATDGLWPDLTVLLDVVPDVARARLAGVPDRMENASADFHARVRHGYLRLAEADPQRWVVVDGSAVADVVAAEVARRVDGRP